MFVCSLCGESNAGSGYCPNDGSELVDSGDDSFLGTVVGSYRIASLLGVGGMGRVYKGVNPTIGSRVAIKVLNHEGAQNRELVERFFAEARAVNLIRHEGIVNIVDLATLPDQRPYIVMEYLDGFPLSTLMKRGGQLPLGSFLKSMIEVLEALGAAHGNSIVHRDLKPDNIFISPQGRAKVLDFGIAKLTSEDSGRSGVTQDGSLLGTPHYMSPEQAVGHPVDSQSDIYSMGVILFEGVLGQTPFVGDSLYDLLRQHVQTQPPTPRLLRPDIPPELEATILRALAKEPGARQQSVQALAGELSSISRQLPAHAWTAMHTLVERGLPGPQVAATQIHNSHRSNERDSERVPELFFTKSLPPQQIPAATSVSKRGVRRSLILSTVILASALAVGLWVSQSGKNGASEAEASDEGARDELAPLAFRSQDVAPARDSSNEPVGAGPSANPPPDGGIAETSRSEKSGGTSPSTGQPVSQVGDTSHRVTELVNPESIDVEVFGREARAQARAVFPDAELVRIDSMGVSPDGTANISLDSSFIVLYRYQSRSRSKRPKNLPMGVENKASCSYLVMANEKTKMAYGMPNSGCKELYTGPPKCSPKQVWKRAIAKGAPAKGAVAMLSLWKKRDGVHWYFQITGTRYAWFIPDDCK